MIGKGNQDKQTTITKVNFKNNDATKITLEDIFIFIILELMVLLYSGIIATVIAHFDCLVEWVLNNFLNWLVPLDCINGCVEMLYNTINPSRSIILVTMIFLTNILFNLDLRNEK